MVSEEQVLKVWGFEFGFGMQLPPPSLQRKFFRDQPFGGNIAHLAPEVMHTVQKASKNLMLYSTGKHETFKDCLFFFEVERENLLSIGFKSSSDTMLSNIAKCGLDQFVKKDAIEDWTMHTRRHEWYKLITGD